MKIKRSTLVLWKKRLVWFFGVVVVASGITFYFFSQVFTITSYELIGVDADHTQVVLSGLRDVTTHKLYKIFPGNKVLTYSRQAFVSKLVETLPTTETVTILPLGLHTLRITVTSYKPLFKIDATHGMTQDGILYTDYRSLDALPELAIASSTLRDVNHDGVHAFQVVGVNQATLLQLSKLIQEINAVVFTVAQVSIDTYGDITFYSENGSSVIRFSRASDTDKVWSTIVSAIDTEPLKSKLADNKSGLEYLDARFGNKVFYKFTGDTPLTKLANKDTTAIIEHNEATTTPMAKALRR